MARFYLVWRNERVVSLACHPQPRAPRACGEGWLSRAFDAQRAVRPGLYVEWLDSARFPEARQLEAVRDHLAAKYARRAAATTRTCSEATDMDCRSW